MRRKLAAAITLLMVTGSLLPTGMNAWAAVNHDSVPAPAERHDFGDEIEKLAARLEQAPDDHDARFAYARLLSWSSRWEEALAEYDVLLLVDPRNSDYLLGKAQVLAWSGRPNAALPLLEAAAAQAPGYEAVHDLRARLLGQYERGPVREVEAGLELQDLDGGLPGWSRQYVELSHRAAPRHIYFGGLQRTERFDQADLEASLGVAWPVGQDWLAAVEAHIAPGAEVLPRRSGQLRIRRDFKAGWGAELGARRAVYTRNDLDVWTITTDRYLGHWHVAWTVYASKLEGAGATWSNQLRVDRYFGDGNRLGAIASAGRETESLGSGQFTTNDTVGLSILGLYWFSRQWGVSWELLAHEQGDAYLRRGFRVGLRCRY